MALFALFPPLLSVWHAVRVAVTLIIVHWQSSKYGKINPSFTLFCFTAPCSFNSEAPQSDSANGVPSHQAMRPTITCGAIVHIKPVGKLANTHYAVALF